ncbi:MAG: YfhO family protein, partial [Bacteroidaceae bacterium]|nr:YfhO family protein [Bacteroidaceae bacterium]
YITQWSYGISETWTLLVPNAKGGASVPMSESAVAMKKADPQFQQVYDQLPQYWGDQPGTAGPVYVGAFVCMLFILGLIIVKGAMKWALLAATIISILLSWGRNFMPLTDFFIDYFPLYSKFRTVASILVIAEFTIPLLGMMALKRIVDAPDCLGKNYRNLWISFGITAGFAILFALSPSVLGNVISASEMSMMSRIPEEYRLGIIANLTEMRMAVLKADAWRSVIIIVIGTDILFAYKRNILKQNLMVGGLIVLCLFDMWQVNKRYLNDEMFVEPSVKETPQEMTDVDKQILADKSDCGNYRVLNFASNTFNENETSYYHKSIGGYHAAKLQRYQDMITHYISPEMSKTMMALSTAPDGIESVNADSVMPVLNMLNMRYMILPLQDGKTIAMKNPHAMGNAWFVSKVDFVEDANQEIAALGKINLHNTAVADKKFADILKCKADTAIKGEAKITSYAPNHLTYDVKTNKEGVLVFSEVYYPEWTATIDGKEVPVGRVNYILRAIVVPEGNHKVELMFYPKSIDTTETIAYIGYVLLILTFIALVIDTARQRKKQ